MTKLQRGGFCVGFRIARFAKLNVVHPLNSSFSRSACVSGNRSRQPIPKTIIRDTLVEQNYFIQHINLIVFFYKIEIQRFETRTYPS